MLDIASFPQKLALMQISLLSEANWKVFWNELKQSIKKGLKESKFWSEFEMNLKWIFEFEKMKVKLLLL